MKSQITSSFIPQDTVRFENDPKYTKGAFDLIVLASVILFVVSIALGIGTFLYLKFIESSLDNKIQQLDRARSSFDVALISEFTRLDDRMKSAEEILHKHIAPSELLRLLERLTLQSITFDSLDFKVVDNNNITFNLSGIALSVNSIALQADLFGKNTAIISPIFSNINREEGGVRFDVAGTINPSALQYASLVSGRSLVPENTQQEESQKDSQVPVFGPKDSESESNSNDITDTTN